MANNQLIASDNFASGSLAAGWSTLSTLTNTGLVVVGSPNVVEPRDTTGTAYGQQWTALGVLKDQICEVTATLTLESTTFLQLAVRIQPGNSTFSAYNAQIFNGTMTLKRWDAGVATNLGSIVTGLTFAANDVWSLWAAGSCLTVFQNYKPIFVFADATYTSGYAGFYQSTTTNVTHSKVSAFRLYSCAQQDGIWKKQGIAIPALSGDLASSGLGVFQSSGVLFGPGQVLSGNVYKNWFTSGSLTTTQIFYAESSDGLNWARRTLPVITDNVAGAQVIQVGGTFYLYTQAGNAQGSGATILYTSPDGITWTQQSSNVFTGGSGSTGWPLMPFAVINGTWYAFTNHTTGNALFTTGIATSTNGLGTVWTEQNTSVLPPVTAAQAVFPSQATAQIGNKWYTWPIVGASQPQWSGAASNFDPTECARYVSSGPPFTTWTLQNHSMHHSQAFESLNDFHGQIGPVGIYSVNGIAYMLVGTGPGDNSGTHCGQSQVAIAPTSLANLVQFGEDATVQVASDSFTSGTGNLSANWTTPTGGTKLQIVAGNLVQPSVINVSNVMYYSGASFNSSQYSEVTLQTLAGTDAQAWPMVYIQPGAACNGYLLNVQGVIGTLNTTVLQIYKATGAGPTFTVIGPVVGYTPKAGDVFRLSVGVGSDGNIVLSAFQNGSMLLQVEDINNTFTSGAPGMGIFTNTLADVQLSGWAGGNTSVIPNYPQGGFVGWSPLDCRVAVPGFGPAANVGIADAQGNEIFSAQLPPFTGNSQTSNNSAVPPADSRISKPVDSRANVPVNSRVNPIGI